MFGILKPPYAVKPSTERVSVNWRNSITNGLVWLVFPGLGLNYELVGGGSGTLGSTASWDGDRTLRGYALASTATTDTGTYWPRARLPNIVKANSIVIRMKLTTRAIFYDMFRMDNTGSPDGICLSLSDSGTPGSITYQLENAATTANADSAASYISDGDPLRTYGVTRDGSTGVIFYREGAQFNTATLSADQATFNTETSTYGKVLVGAVGTVEWCGVWNRTLTPEENLRLHLDPLQLLDYWPKIHYMPFVLLPNVVPQNVTFLWTGTNASIPSGWVRDTNLDAKYAKGTAAGVDPGGTGGALTHSHTTANHDHTTAHTHTTGNDASETGSSNRDVNTTNPPAAHTHVSNPNTLNPTTTLANDTPSTDAINHEPSYFEVIYIKSDGTPLGVADSAVGLWNDKNSTPSGWNLCDGGGAPARPDMRNRWLKGAAAAGNGGGTGGGLTHTHSIVSHTHTTPYAHTHPNVTSSTTATALGSGDIAGGTASVATSGHTHVFSIDSASPVITGNTDSAASSDHQPPFVVEAFIQNNKGAADLPKGIIGMWGQTLATIPVGWHLCDGTDGTPDLRSNFVKGANTLSDIGTTGGSLTHGASHTATGHTHAVASHTHTETHVSTTGAENRTAGAVATATGTHTHTWANSGAASFTSGTGTPSVNNYTDTQPPFYTVAFIQYKPIRWGIREILQALNRGAVI